MTELLHLMVSASASVDLLATFPHSYRSILGTDAFSLLCFQYITNLITKIQINPHLKYFFETLTFC